jgi:hypothetical protein
LTITAKVIEHSINEYGNELLTVECRYPRFIHAEVMTHRAFSRNAASSRAIPVKKMLHDIKKDMAIPIFWGKNQSGMQAKEQLTGWRLFLAKSIWIASGHVACWFAWLFIQVGLHKQIANRILEPWSHITLLISATEWYNFFGLRLHKDAQPEIQALARAIWEEKQLSFPRLLQADEWHLPYTKQEILATGQHLEDLKKISSARCASTSYKTVDGKEMTLDRALVLGEKLFASEPLHASPAEHQSTPDRKKEDGTWERPDLHGNFTGFIQYRKTLPNETIEDFEL